MAFSDLQLKVAAEAAVEASKSEIAPLTLFAHSYNSEIDGQFGSAIAVPTSDLEATEFGENGYEGEDEFNGALVTLDKHLTTSLRITDKNLAYTGIDFARNAGKAIGNAIGRACFQAAITEAEKATLTATLPTDVFALPETVMGKKMAVKNSVAFVNPTTWTKIVKEVGAYQIYGGTSVIQEGIAQNCLGFKAIVPCAYLASTTKAVVIAENALGTACRYLPPVFDEGVVATRVSDDNGFVYGIREFNDNKFGYGYVAGVALFGAKILDAKGVLKLT